jgi:hypothetical protein
MAIALYKRMDSISVWGRVIEEDPPKSPLIRGTLKICFVFLNLFNQFLLKCFLLCHHEFL